MSFRRLLAAEKIINCLFHNFKAVSAPLAGGAGRIRHVSPFPTAFIATRFICQKVTAMFTLAGTVQIFLRLVSSLLVFASELLFN